MSMGAFSAAIVDYQKALSLNSKDSTAKASLSMAIALRDGKTPVPPPSFHLPPALHALQAKKP